MVAAVVVVAVAVDVAAVIARACRWMAVKPAGRLTAMPVSSLTVKRMPKPALPVARMHLNRPRLPYPAWRALRFTTNLMQKSRRL